MKSGACRSWAMRMARSLTVAGIGLSVVWGPVEVTAQEPPDARWVVRTLDAASKTPIPGVLLSLPGLAESRLTDSAGTAVLPASLGDSLRVVATHLAYSRLDTVLALSADEATVDLLLTRSAIELPSLTVRADRERTQSRELARQMFDREVSVGAVGMTRADVEAVPAIVEADVFRSLQSVAGVTSFNDFGAAMFVRGGNADQVSILLDGTPVFGPYHMFGMFGLFNADAVESTEFYKGSMPARHGGSLSGVVSARQRIGGASGMRVTGGLSLLGLRFAADGSLPWGDARWLVAGRRAAVDMARLDVPYSFHDLNLGLHLYPGEEHRLGFSLMSSRDRFSMEFHGFGESFTSRWSNLVSSLTWSWVPGNRFSGEVAAYHSGYEGVMATGAEGSWRSSTSRVGAWGLRGRATVRGETTGLRAGMVLEGGPVELTGDEGAYVEAEAPATYMHGSVFAEFERWVGPLRLAPGFRVGTELSGSRFFAEPRLSARVHMGPFAVSVSLDRAYQFLSAIRDDRHFVPGAPMWHLREKGQPVSVADGAGLALDYWRGENWTGSLTAWIRSFRDTPSWHPETSRSIDVLEYHDGRAHGWEAAVQRHTGLLSGWLSYQQTWVAYTDGEGDGYRPLWDRRHEVDATLALRDIWGWSASLRGTVGSGTPFWVPVGSIWARRYDPRNEPGEVSPESIVGLGSGGRVTILSDTQARYPYYGRVDFSCRYAFDWGDWEIIPFVTVANVTGRENVLSYVASRGQLLVTQQIPLLPFIGVDLKF